MRQNLFVIALGISGAGALSGYILLPALLIFVAFVVAVAFAWKSAYFDSPTYDKWGRYKVKPEVYEYDPTGVNTYKKV